MFSSEFLDRLDSNALYNPSSSSCLLILSKISFSLLIAFSSFVNLKNGCWSFNFFFSYFWIYDWSFVSLPYDWLWLEKNNQELFSKLTLLFYNSTFLLLNITVGWLTSQVFTGFCKSSLSGFLFSFFVNLLWFED